MRALLSEVVGGPETLRIGDLPEPAPGAGEIRIAVAACGINFPDALIIEDRYQYKQERPFAPGCEVGGVVDAVGAGVTGFRVGDRVLGGYLCGGLATKLVLPASRCFHIPDAMPFDIAASFLMTYGTSQHALVDRGRVQPGETLLVLGAAGGVGLAAVQIGKYLGARVIAGVSSAEKADAVRRAGADTVIVYPRGELDKTAARAFSAEIRAQAGGDVDVIYDPMGGSYAEPAFRTLGWDGRYLVIGFTAGIAALPLNLPLLKGANVVGVFWGAFIDRFPERNRENVARLMQWYVDGALDPVISARFPLERGGEAIARLTSRNAVGKVVVMVGE